MATAGPGPADTGGGPPGRLRADAVRNRERILEVAGEVFATQGLDASMVDIAAAAGVGVGTVYRRFPDREDLIGGVFEQRLAGLERLALRAARRADPWDAIAWLFEEVLVLEASDRGLFQLLEDEGRRRVMLGRVDTLRTVMAGLVEAAQRSGQLRGDVGLGDFLVLKRMLVEAAVTTRSADPDYWRRMLALCLEGLRAPGSVPLPGRPLDLGELERGAEGARGAELEATGGHQPRAEGRNAKPKAITATHSRVTTTR